MTSISDTLVTWPKFQTFSDYLELYPKPVRIKRPSTGPTPEPPSRQDTEIKGLIIKKINLIQERDSKYQHIATYLY